MKISEKIKKFVNNPNKIIFSAYFSALITFLFAIYNIFLGLYYADSWSISFSIYYLCLTCARVIVILIERKVNAYPQDFAVSIRKKSMHWSVDFYVLYRFMFVCTYNFDVAPPKSSCIWNDSCNSHCNLHNLQNNCGNNKLQQSKERGEIDL